MSKAVDFVLPEDFILRRVFIVVVLLGASVLFHFRGSDQIQYVIPVLVSVVLFVPVYHLWKRFVFPVSLAVVFFWIAAAMNISQPFLSAAETNFLSTAALTVLVLVFFRFVIYLFFETSP